MVFDHLRATRKRPLWWVHAVLGSWLRAALPAALVAVLGVVLGVAPALGAVVHAQSGTVAGIRSSGTAYVDVAALAKASGEIVVEGERSLTWRAAGGVLTVFDGSPDGLLGTTASAAAGAGAGGAETAAGASTAEDVSFSAPVLVREGTWFVPVDALALVGLHFGDGVVRLPDGRLLTLELPPPPVAEASGSSEIETLAHGVVALRFFAPSGAAPIHPGASLMLTDLGLLSLVEPDQAAAIDAASRSIGTDKGLLLVVSSLHDERWEPSLRFSQDGREIEVRSPYRLKLVRGSVEVVGPDTPVTGVVLLPPSFTLYRPLHVTWQGMSAEVTFRR